MKEILSKFNKWDYIFLAILGIGYYFLVVQYLPCGDDIKYTFDKSSDKYSQCILSFNDVIRSQCYDYFHTNGRFLVHVLVQCFCGYIGPVPFFIGSTIAVIFLVMGIVYLIRRHDGDKYIYEVPLVTLLLLLLIPNISITYLGYIAFTMNYLWSSCLYIWFLIFYFKLLNNEITFNWWKDILLCLYAAICGQWQESFGIGIGGTLFIYHLIHIKETKGTLLAYLLCFAFGLLSNILAPGNFMRVSEKGVLQYDNTIDLVKVLFSSFRSVVFSTPFTIFLLAIIICLFLHRKDKWNYIKKNYLFILPQILAFIFAISIAYMGEYQMTMPVLMTIVLFCVNLHELHIHFLHVKDIHIAMVLVLILFVLYIPIHKSREQIKKLTEIYIESMWNATDSVADSHLIENYMAYEMSDSYFKRYINSWVLTYQRKITHLELSHYLTRDTSVLTTIALPEPIQNIVAQCNTSNELTDDMYRYIKYPYYFIVKVPENVSAKSVRVKYLIEPSTRNQKIIYFLTGQKPDTVEIPLLGVTYREFIYDGYKYIINGSDIYVLRYKDIKYLEVIY